MNARRWSFSFCLKCLLTSSRRPSFLLPLGISLFPRRTTSFDGDGAQSGSGSSGFVRPTNFTEAEPHVLWENAMLVLPAWHLPHRWNVSVAGYVIPPISDGVESKPL
jgi:hypothetical protein